MSLYTSPLYKHVSKGSFFEECDRDDKGHCKPGEGGDSSKPDDAGGEEIEYTVDENVHGDHLTNEASKLFNKAYDGLNDAGSDLVYGLKNLMEDIERAVDDDENTVDMDAIDGVTSEAEAYVEQATDQALAYANSLTEDVKDHIYEIFSPEEGSEAFDKVFESAAEEFENAISEANETFSNACEIAKEAVDDYAKIRSTINKEDPEVYAKDFEDAIKNISEKAADEFRAATAKAAEKLFKVCHDASPYNPPDDDGEEDKGLESSPLYRKSIAKAGFSGKREDKNGRTICYQDGKRVPCNALGGKKKPPAKKPEKKPVEATVKEIKDLVESGHGTPAKLLELVKTHTVVELKKIQAEMGLKVKGNPLKVERVKKLTDAVLQLMPKVDQPDTGIPTPDDLATPTGKLTFNDLKDRLPSLSEQELVRGIASLETMGKARTKVENGRMTDIEFTGQVTQEDLDEAFEPNYAKKIASNVKLREKVQSVASIPNPKEETEKISQKLLVDIQEVLAKADKLKGRKREVLLGEYEKLRNQRYQELYSGAKRRDAEARAKLVESIKVDNPSEIPFKWEGGESEGFKRATLESRAFLSKILAKTGDKGMVGQIGMVEKEGRAHYSIENDQVVCSSYNDVATFVHEFSHAIEEKMPGVHEACVDFLRERTRGDELVSLKDKFGDQFRDNEFGRADDFAKAFGDAEGAERNGLYVGKDYGGRATEILSMGVELLYRDPSGFAKRDPEYCAFVLGILDGSLRSKKKRKEDFAELIDVEG